MSHIQEKKAIQQPERFSYAIRKLEKLGFEIYRITETAFKFDFQGNEITLFPYSGWYTGKGIKDGRGIHNLLKQIN